MSTLHCQLPTVSPPSAPRLRARVPNELPPIPPELQTPASPLKTQDSRLTPLLNLLTRLGFSVRQLAIACDLSATDLLEFIEDPGIDDKLSRLEAVLERTLRLRLLDSAITAVDELEKLTLAAEEHPTERRRAATTLLRAARPPSATGVRTSATGVRTSATGVRTSATGVRTSATGVRTSGTGVPPVRPHTPPVIPYHSSTSGLKTQDSPLFPPFTPYPSSPSGLKTQDSGLTPRLPSAPPREQRRKPSAAQHLHRLAGLATFPDTS